MTSEVVTAKEQAESAEQESPPIAGMIYWVRCDGYRTRAIYTTSGKWLLPHNGKEVEGVHGFFS